MTTDITIKPVSDTDEFNTVEVLQQRIWGIDANGSWVPTHLLITVAKNGGLVLGAYTPTGEMVGFVFGFLGATNADRAARGAGPMIHCSHMMGVLPDYAGQGIGAALKLAQRDHLLRQGLKLATWTFDPLLGRNAHLNITKLGTVVRQYHVSLYGEINESLNAGLPTDRFEAEWWLEATRSTDWQDGDAEPINSTQAAGKHRAPADWHKTDAPTFLVEIPADFQTMRTEDMPLAREWRLHSREVFTWALGEAGYVVGWFSSTITDDERRNYYVLTHDYQQAGIPPKED